MMAFLNADELDMAGVLAQAQKKFNGFVSLGSYPVLDNRCVNQHVYTIVYCVIVV